MTFEDEIKNTFGKRLENLITEGTESMNNQAQEMDIPVQTLYKYLFKAGGKAPTSICGIDKLVKIAKYYNVSTDYLLGLTDVKSNNAEIAAVCEFTGLSEKVIEILCSFRHYRNYNYLSDFLEKADLFNLIIELDKLQANSEKVFEYLSGKFENNPGLNNSSTSEIFDISNHVSIYENPCDIAKYKIEEIIRDYLNKCDIRKYKTDINGNTWNEMQRALQNRYSECYEKDVKPLTDNPNNIHKGT